MRNEHAMIDYDFHRSHAHQLRREAVHAFFSQLVRRLRLQKGRGIEMDLFHQRTTLPLA
jgi:hypothetical protein